MKVSERELPGVGTKYVLTTEERERMAVVAGPGGRRDVFLFGAGDEAPTATIRLRDREARILGAILGGWYPRPGEGLVERTGSRAIRPGAVPAG